MGILPSSNQISTIAWFHQLDFDEVSGEKKLDEK